MKRLTYSVYSDTTNAYGQKTLIPVEGGNILIDIEPYNYNMANNALYAEAKYIGISHQNISDKSVIDNKYKVIYINSNGRYNTYYLGDYR